MSLLDKVKNLFYEDGEEEPIKSEMIQVEIPAPEVKREVIKEDDVSDNKVLKEEAKTPVFFNDDDFKELEKPKEVVKSSYLKEKPVIKKEEKKIFKPTPIISPVYGVLDKNYHKEDITSKRQVSLSDTASLSIDDVRKKAYGTLEDDLENTMFGSNSILFNKETEKEEIKEETLLKDLTDVIELDEAEKEIETENPKDDKDLFDLIDSMYEEDK